jgi:hypothetical protein
MGRGITAVLKQGHPKPTVGSFLLLLLYETTALCSGVGSSPAASVAAHL